MLVIPLLIVDVLFLFYVSQFTLTQCIFDRFLDFFFVIASISLLFHDKVSFMSSFLLHQYFCFLFRTPCLIDLYINGVHKVWTHGRVSIKDFFTCVQTL